MSLIRCTKKLLAELPSTVEGEAFKATILGDWHANLLRIERRKCVLFTNDETLFSVFVPMLKKTHFQNLSTVFLDYLIETLLLEGFDGIIEKVKSDYANNIVYSKTNNRSVMGSMNDIARFLPFLIERQGGIESAEPLEINRTLNRMPLIKKHCFYAVECLRQTLFPSSIQGLGEQWKKKPT